VFYPRVAIPVGGVAHDDTSPPAASRVRWCRPSTGWASPAPSSASRTARRRSPSLPTRGPLPLRAQRAGQLSAGAHLLRRIHRLLARVGDSPIAFTLRPGERIRGVRFSLRPARTCKGSVVDQAASRSRARTCELDVRPQGLPPAGQRRDRRPGTLRGHRHGGGGSRGPPHRADGSRVHRLLDLRPVHADPSSRASARRGHSDVAGRVEDADGRPVVGASLEAWASPVTSNRRNTPSPAASPARAGASSSARWTRPPTA
jgi:hypothetical protein